jgi:hypothetical protein
MTHASPPRGQKPRVSWVTLVGILVAGLVAGAALHARIEARLPSSRPRASATVTVTAPQVTVTKPAVTLPAPPRKTVTARPPGPVTSIQGDGTYEIGVDLKPGTYKSAGGAGCYWARLKTLDGGVNSIIANNLSDGPQTVMLRASDKGFETARCGPWAKVG